MPNQRAKVLIVDDYDVNLELLEAYLIQSHPNFEVIKARSGLEAMSVFNTRELDLVLLDVMLPDINGFDLCRMMKDIRQENFLPIILITALFDRESMMEGLSNGADDFLSKPVNSDELSVRIRNLLRLRRATVDLNEKYDDLNRDLQLARNVLNDFLPKELPDPNKVYTEIIYEPSGVIGGDFYDIVTIDESSYGFFIADVKGHGASAALMVALLKEQLYEHRRHWSQPAVLMKALNRTMSRFFSATRDDFFITACYLIYNHATKQFSWVNAGHTPPAYFENGSAVLLREASGLPLGFMENTDYDVGVQEVKRYASLLLYTDGMFEMPLFYQKERYFDEMSDIFQLLQRSGIQPTASMILSEVSSALRNYEQHDDVHIIGLRF